MNFIIEWLINKLTKRHAIYSSDGMRETSILLDQKSKWTHDLGLVTDDPIRKDDVATSEGQYVFFFSP
jgi:hypothetical protein